MTILSEESVDGDGLSTTCFSLGLEKGLELANSLDGIYACFTMRIIMFIIRTGWKTLSLNNNPRLSASGIRRHCSLIGY